MTTHPAHSDLKRYSESLGAYKEKMSLAHSSPRFGYRALDEMIPGLLPGQLTVVAGGTSMGKTTFLANCAYNMAYHQRKRVLYASLESGDAVAKPIENLAKDQDVELLSILAPKSTISLESLDRLVRDNIDQCEILIIDHIHYLATSRTNNYSAQIGDLVRRVQMMAIKHHIPIILVAHVRKLKSESDIPSLHDLKDSSALYQDPSIVLIIHRFKNETSDLLSEENKQKFENRGLLILEKNRDFGYTGKLGLEFDPQTLQFSIGGQWAQ